MTLRERAKSLLKQRGVHDGHLVTSKFYGPAESWTKGKAWWVQIPWSAVRTGKSIHIVLEASPGSERLRYLRVPAEYFIINEQSLATLAPDKINLFLAAERGDELVDQRGPGRISFARFEQDAAEV